MVDREDNATATALEPEPVLPVEDDLAGTTRAHPASTKETDRKACGTRGPPHVANWLALLVCAVPIATVVVLAAIYAVNVPYHDEWDWSVTRVLSGDLFALRLDRFWALGNEHRVFVPQLLMTAIAHVTNLDMIVPVYVKIALTAVTLGVWVRLFARTSGVPVAWFAMPAAFLLFSLAQWPRWIDVRPVPSTISILGLASALLLTCAGDRSTKRFVGAALFAAMSSLSYFSGNITWLAVGAVLIVRRFPRRYLVAWAGCAALVLVPYCLDFFASVSPARTEEPAGALTMLGFVLAFLGGTMTSDPGGNFGLTQAVLFGTFGVAACIGISIAWLRTGGGRVLTILPWLAVSGWVALNATAAAYGRAAVTGLAGAQVPRYGVFCVLFWIALAAIAVITIWTASVPRRLRNVGKLLATVVVLGILNSTVAVFGSGTLDHMPARLRAGRDALLRAGPALDAGLTALYPQPDHIRRFLPALIERQASFLAGNHPLTRFGRQPLTLSDASILHESGPLTSSTEQHDGNEHHVVRGPAPFIVSWSGPCLDRTVVTFRCEWKSLDASPVTLRILLREPGDPTVRALAEVNSQGVLRGVRSIEADLSPFRGRPIEVAIEAKVTDRRTPRIELIGPHVHYSMNYHP